MPKAKKIQGVLTHGEFVEKAIKALRTKGYKGIHTVYSGFNAAFKDYFKGDDPIAVTTALAAIGAIVIRPVKKGVMLYLPSDAPQIHDNAKDALAKMGV